MPKKLEAYYAARRQQDEIEKYLSPVGRSSNPTVRKLGLVTVKTLIHGQPPTGAPSPYECLAFDEALATVIRNNFGELADRVLRSIRTKVAECAEEAQDELNDLQSAFRSALRDKEG